MEKRMKPIKPGDRRVANIHRADFRPFIFPDGLALRVGMLQLDGDQELGVGFHICRMPAGMTTRSHRRNGHGRLLILDGELHESDGTIPRAGDPVFCRGGIGH
jgi:hypothetical protein